MPPLGAYRVLDMPLGEVARDVIELGDALGDEVNAVHQRIGDTTDAGQQFAILCDFVRRRVARSRVRVRADAQMAVERLRRSHGGERIESVCRDVGISRKHLGAVLRAHVGLSPKAYARMFRFRHVVDQVLGGRRAPDWAQLAVSCGYYDQSHFNHEFREFAGMSPNEFAAAGSTDGLTVVVGA
jgi:AraC-like DNA-binding protein